MPERPLGQWSRPACDRDPRLVVVPGGVLRTVAGGRSARRAAGRGRPAQRPTPAAGPGRAAPGDNPRLQARGRGSGRGAGGDCGRGGRVCAGRPLDPGAAGTGVDGGGRRPRCISAVPGPRRPQRPLDLGRLRVRERHLGQPGLRRLRGPARVHSANEPGLHHGRHRRDSSGAQLSARCALPAGHHAAGLRSAYGCGLRPLHGRRGWPGRDQPGFDRATRRDARGRGGTRRSAGRDPEPALPVRPAWGDQGDRRRGVAGHRSRRRRRVAGTAVRSCGRWCC